MFQRRRRNKYGLFEFLIDLITLPFVVLVWVIEWFTDNN